MEEKNIQENINKYIKLRPKYKLLGEKVASIIVEVLDIKGINYHAVSSRAKTIESFSKKIDSPKYNNPLEQITDLSGIRVVAYVENDVLEICKIIEELFEIDKDNSLDKSTELGEDKVGYKSVHFIGNLPENRTDLPEYERFKELKFEIQVRTILQHSWAEIEHDKNYKFSGELPTEIKRRFKLLAGSLEIADREFNQLSKEIDNYSIDIKERTEKGELNIPINSISLKEYFSSKLNSPKIDYNFNSPRSVNMIIDELNSFGIKKIADFDKIIPSDLLNVIERTNKYQTTFLGIVRSVLFINDYKKYFSKSFVGGWGKINENTISLLKHYNIDIDDLEQSLIEAKQRLNKG